MGFLLLLKFAVKCFDILAWPLLSLGYPLCASIRVIEADSNSDIQKLVTYWVLFSLISLFDHAFARLLEWLSFWPYVKLTVIFWLVVPDFDSSLYVYENLVRPCFSIKPLAVIERCNKRKEKLFLERENFLVTAEIYLKENGPEALEKLISGKCTELDVDEKEIKAVAATEKKEVEPVNQTVPNLPQTENQTFTASGTKETAATTAATAGSDFKLPEIPASMKVQKEWAYVLCQVTTQSETTLLSHLQGQRPDPPKAEAKKCESSSGSNQKITGSTAKKSDQLNADARKCVASNGLNQKNTGNGSNQKNSGSTDKKSEQPKDQKNSGSTDKKSDQPKADAKKCVASNGLNQKNTGKRVEKVEVLGKQKNPKKNWCWN